MIPCGTPSVFSHEACVTHNFRFSQTNFLWINTRIQKLLLLGAWKFMRKIKKNMTGDSPICKKIQQNGLKRTLSADFYSLRDAFLYH